MTAEMKPTIDKLIDNYAEASRNLKLAEDIETLISNLSDIRPLTNNTFASEEELELVCETLLNYGADHCRGEDWRQAKIAWIMSLNLFEEHLEIRSLCSLEYVSTALLNLGDLYLNSSYPNMNRPMAIEYYLECSVLLAKLAQVNSYQSQTTIQNMCKALLLFGEANFDTLELEKENIPAALDSWIMCIEFSNMISEHASARCASFSKKALSYLEEFTKNPKYAVIAPDEVNRASLLLKELEPPALNLELH
jgi:hypothetical protein